MIMKWVITCEHAGNEVPERYRHLFNNDRSVLQTHRAVDTDAVKVYEVLKTSCADFALCYEYTRLLIELNRSLHHPNLFSEFTKKLPENEKNNLISQYYLPYRNLVTNKILGFLDAGDTTIHISVHSFTPQLNGMVRNADIGLLYDPARTGEKELCRIWQQNIHAQSPLKVRRNYPYKGIDDGLTTWLRKKFPVRYLGIELEINQIHNAEMGSIAAMLAATLKLARRHFSA